MTPTTKSTTKHSLESIAADLAIIFGGPEPVPVPVAEPAIRPGLFLDNPTPKEAVSSWYRLCYTYAEDGDEFFEDMLRYRKRKLRDQAKDAEKKAREAARRR